MDDVLIALADRLAADGYAPEAAGVLADYLEESGECAVADELTSARNPPYVRAAVAGHPALAGRLIADPDYSVRAVVARHQALAGRLLADPALAVRAAAAVACYR
jgi:hypothetical protein